MHFLKAFLVIPLTEDEFLKGHETLYPWLSSINRASVQHFGGLKMRFFIRYETLDSEVSSIHKASVRPFGGLTIIFFKVNESIG
jgi:hypothetical protein